MSNKIPSLQFRPEYVSFDCYGTPDQLPDHPRHA
jgi:hypothetical protein